MIRNKCGFAGSTDSPRKEREPEGMSVRASFQPSDLCGTVGGMDSDKEEVGQDF